MKYVTIIFFVIAVSLLFCGVYYDVSGTDEVMKNKLYGFGTICLFFLAMPGFLIYRRNKTSISKYMLNRPNEEDKKETE